MIPCEKQWGEGVKMKQRQLRTNSQRRGFTLIEVLLVLAILGVIAAMLVPSLLGRQKKALVDQTKLNIKALEGILRQYALDHDGEMPTTAEGLEVLITAPNNDDKWNGPYVTETKTLPSDAWGRPFQYEYPPQHQQGGEKPDISSSGPDKQFGTPDDVTNW